MNVCKHCLYDHETVEREERIAIHQDKHSVDDNPYTAIDPCEYCGSEFPKFEPKPIHAYWYSIFDDQYLMYYNGTDEELIDFVASDMGVDIEDIEILDVYEDVKSGWYFKLDWT